MASTVRRGGYIVMANRESGVPARSIPAFGHGAAGDSMVAASLASLGDANWGRPQRKAQAAGIEWPDALKIERTLRFEGIDVALVSGPEDAIRSLKSSPDLHVEWNAPVRPAVRQAMRLRNPKWTKDPTIEPRRLVVTVQDESGHPIRGARVLALADPAGEEGIDQKTGKSGTLRLTLPNRNAKVHALVVEPPPGFWGHAVAMADASALDTPITVALAPVNARAASAALRRAFLGLPLDGGGGVRVAVIDTGIDRTHPDLDGRVVDSWSATGSNAPPDQAHGTHVAGLIGGSGQGGFTGLAPRAELIDIRVFAEGRYASDLLALGNGIEAAAKKDVHLINISLETDQNSELVRRAVAFAYRRGAVCFAAAGNDGNPAPAFPAFGKRVLAVAAYGDSEMLPPGGPEIRELTGFGAAQHPHLRFARFSNYGAEIDLIGPGVGIVSCGLAGGYLVLNGTSQSCPTMTGAAAALLSHQYPDILRMPADRNRADAILAVVQRHARTLGFKPEYEGLGQLLA